MREFSKIGEELFNKLRGRFSSVTIGDSQGNVTNEPIAARYFDFDYKGLGKVSVNLDEDEGLTVIFSKDFAEGTSDVIKKSWHDFLKELRVFGKKRMLDFSVRDITKSNLDKRDYKFLATNRSGDDKMTESKLYGTSRISYQNVGEARIMIKHTESVNQESVTGRTQKIGKIYIESPDGERFRYPYKHLSGARAMARHVAEGGNAYDDFGKHIVGLSEEMGKLRKFKNYMGRSAVMAESLAGYVDIVKERISTVKKTIESLQKPAYYAETFAAFETPVFEDVPSDVAENWIDELTIKQFNEELQDIFPYIYNLVKEGTKAKELGPEDIVDESGLQYYTGVKKHGKEYMKKAAQAGRDGASQEELGKLKDKYSKAEKTKEEIELEAAFEATMGQFSDHVCEECGNQSWTTLEMTEEDIEEACSSMRKKKKNESDVEEGERHGNSKIYDKCWKGYRKVPGKKAGEEGSCKKVEGITFEDEEDADEGNAYAHAVKKAKMNGKKKGDKVDGPDGDEITLEKDQKTPLGEFILSYFDRENGQFPKGETAVLTMVEKDYGEQFIEPAKAFIEQVTSKFDEWQMRTQPQQIEGRYDGPNSSCCDAPIKNYENGMGICSDCGDNASPHEDEVDEGQYDGKSREELLKMKDEAEASMKNYKPTGDDPQSRFYDETQMMMAQQHLDSINKALDKVGEATGDFDRMRELAGLR